jgi:hypothetical protein
MPKQPKKIAHAIASAEGSGAPQAISNQDRYGAPDKGPSVEQEIARLERLLGPKLAAQCPTHMKGAGRLHFLENLELISRPSRRPAPEPQPELPAPPRVMRRGSAAIRAYAAEFERSQALCGPALDRLVAAAPRVEAALEAGQKALDDWNALCEEITRSGFPGAHIALETLRPVMERLTAHGPLRQRRRQTDLRAPLPSLEKAAHDARGAIMKRRPSWT